MTAELLHESCGVWVSVEESPWKQAGLALIAQDEDEDLDEFDDFDDDDDEEFDEFGDDDEYEDEDFNDEDDDDL